VVNSRHGHSWSPLGPQVDTAELVRLQSHILMNYRDCPWVSPSMLDMATASKDHSDLLAWAINVAHVLHRDVFIDREYFYTQAIELPDGLTMYGRGSDKPGLTMRLDLIQERMRRDIGNWSPKWACTTEAQYKMGLSPPTIVHKNDCYSLTIRDLQINGGQQLFDWRALVNDPVKFNAKETSDALKNSPMCSGLYFGNQNGRRCDGLKVRLDNVHVHDFAGSCLIAHPDVRLTTRDESLGNSVSGRILYYAPGVHSNLCLYGFSRSSVARLIPPFDCSSFSYRFGSGPPNPWPENDQPEAVIGTALVNTNERVVIRGGIIDNSGSEYAAAMKLGCHCEIDARVNGRVELHPNHLDDQILRLKLSGDAQPGNFTRKTGKYRDFSLTID
jgi:hypothetical protein